MQKPGPLHGHSSPWLQSPSPTNRHTWQHDSVPHVERGTSAAKGLAKCHLAAGNTDCTTKQSPAANGPRGEARGTSP
jgi:hypothetical protein